VSRHRPASIPEGYARERIGAAEAVVRLDQAAALRAALVHGTLYDWAARHPERRTFEGRGPVYAVPLPGTATWAAVRHVRHGGLLAPLTGDRFAGRTRAPRELATALRLEAAGIRTPPVLGYVLYPAGLGLRRSDVATRLVEGVDLAAMLRAPDAALRRPPLIATARLLAALARAGAVHRDLNLKNVLIARPRDEVVAYVLDVDRVRFGAEHDPAIAAANLARLERSLAKWRREHALPITGAELALLRAHAGH
jgi:tRNA A-37 threonylcarbamoyl transferase component Bud32